MPNKISNADSVAALLPLKAQDYHILFVVLEGECHGYRMVKEIDRQTGGQIRMEAGNLYRSLRRMIGQGLIIESLRRPAPESDDERRRYVNFLRPHGRFRATEFQGKLGRAYLCLRACLPEIGFSERGQRHPGKDTIGRRIRQFLS